MAYFYIYHHPALAQRGGVCYNGSSISPGGGIGRRVGLKIRFPLKECGFDPHLGQGFLMEKVYYHGSPLSDLSFLRDGSWVSPDRNVAYQMGRYYKETGMHWYDSDLQEKYNFKGEPKFKKDRVPDGVPTVYLVKNANITATKNPQEYQLIGVHPAIKE